MSIKALNWAFEVELPPLQKLVLIVLADRANVDEAACYPSYKDMKKRTGLSETGIRTQIQALTEGGLLWVEKRGGDDTGQRQTTNQYFLVMDGSPPADGGEAPPAGEGGRVRRADPPVNHHKEPPVKNRSRTTYSTSNDNDLGLDPTVQAGLEDEIDPEPVNIGEYLAWYFRQNIDSPFRANNKSIFIRNIRLWMTDGLSPDRIKLMIDHYAAEIRNTGRPAPTVPWKHFIASRGHLLAMTETLAKGQENRDHANDDAYWLGNAAKRKD